MQTSRKVIISTPYLNCSFVVDLFYVCVVTVIGVVVVVVRELYIILYMYSKTSVNRPLKNRQNKES